MPRPRQRRGADAKKEDKKAKRDKEEEEARAKEAAEKRERYRKKEMDYAALPTAAAAPLKRKSAIAASSTNAGEGEQGDQESAGVEVVEEVVDPDALPEVAPDTKAYFKQVADKIREIEDLTRTSGQTYKPGHGMGETAEGQDAGEQDEEDDDERPLLLRAALESLSGHEIALAGDSDTSIILERLLFAMDDFARRVLGDRFRGSYEVLCRHRNASHVLQTLFSLAGETVDRETRGIVAAPPQASTSTVLLPSMTSLVLSALSEILPFLSTLIYDPFGTHVVRIFLLLLSGTPPIAEGDTSRSSERSKKSQTWRGKQGPMKSFLDQPTSRGGADQVKVVARAVPVEFKKALQEMYASLNELDDGGPEGEGVRRAAMDDVAGPAIRMLVQLEAGGEGWKAHGWADRVLFGLVGEEAGGEQNQERTEARLEYLTGLLRHPASSPTFESLLTFASPALFSALWASLFSTRLARLAGHAVGNFVVAKGLARVNAVEMESAVEELWNIGRERRGEMIDNSRTGVLRALLERAAQLKCCEKRVGDMILDTFQVDKIEDQTFLIPCILSLNRLEYYKKLPAHLTATASTQGSVLLQTWLTLNAPHQQVVIDAITSLGIEGILPLTRDPTSSRILDSFLSSPTTPPRALRQFLMSLLTHYHTIADDRIGSRVVERCWATADVYLKDKIAASLVDYSTFLQASAYGHFFARKLELPLFSRRREEWKAKMAGTVKREYGGKVKEAKVVEEKKRRMRQFDEIDELFAAGGGAQTKRIRVEGSQDEQAVEEAVEFEVPQEEEKKKVKKVDQKKKMQDNGLGAIYAALQDSAPLDE